MDAHFDLIKEFDESYLHSGADNSDDMKYFTRLSRFQTVKWMTIYTDNLQDVMDQVNASAYEVRFAWADQGARCWWDPYGYQHPNGPEHLHHGHYPPGHF